MGLIMATATGLAVLILSYLRYQQLSAGPI